ncbi:MAG: hypothetical protein ACXVJT_07890 [Thermoanaerobaculia bacterium]
MAPKKLLPGIESPECPPAIVCDSRGSIRKARTRATVRDILQVVLFVGVNYLFVRWPSSHVPFTDRHTSVVLMAAIDGAFFVWLWLSRVMPRWSARRIAATWSAAERRRHDRL